MAAGVLQRVAYALGLLLAVSLVGFGLLHLMPGDVAEVLLMAQLDGQVPSAEALAKFRALHGFDRPLPVQYVHWLGRALTGDLGRSLVTGQPIAAQLPLRLLHSLLLAAAGMALALALALPLALAAARYPNGLIDRAARVFAVLGMSMPNFWYGLLLALLFALVLGWLPSSGFGSWQHLILPAVVVGTSVAGLTMRYARNLLLEEAGRPYMRTAAAKGLGRTAALVKHALPNATPALLTLVGLQFARVFDGVIVVETLFGWPGLGRFLVEALLGRDYTAVQASFLIIASAYVVINLLVDLAVTAMDPRVEGAV